MTSENKNILFVTDMSNDCRDAYDYALKIASACRGKMTLLHVIEAHPVSLDKRIKKLFGEERYEEIMKEHEQEARSVLIGKRKESDMAKAALYKLAEDFSGRRPKELVQEDKIIVKRGAVAEEIIATANEEENDLIILTAHASAPEESYVSKTIRDIIRLSRVPVTIVPATDIVEM